MCMSRLLLLSVVGFASVAAAQSEGRTRLIETKYLHFYSDLDFNHHNFLYGLAQTGSDLAGEEQACHDTLPADGIAA